MSGPFILMALSEQFTKMKEFFDFSCTDSLPVPIRMHRCKQLFTHAFEAVTDQSWIPSSTWRNFDFRDHKAIPLKKVDFLDEVPVMSATVLGLDMLLQEPYIDLRMTSDLILSDVGATIQILRLIAKEYDIAEERPSRMVDCIASLDANAWFPAISGRTFSRDWKHSATTAVWMHCRRVAQYTQLVAESLDGISSEDAYMVGLLHGIGEIPAALGWPHGGRDAKEQGALFAIEETLPIFVRVALNYTKDSSTSSVWKFILTTAHELAGVRSDLEAPEYRDMGAMAVASH